MATLMLGAYPRNVPYGSMIVNIQNGLTPGLHVTRHFLMGAAPKPARG